MMTEHLRLLAQQLRTERDAAHQEVAELRRTVARDLDAHREAAGHATGCLCARCCALTAAAGVAEWGLQ